MEMISFHLLWLLILSFPFPSCSSSLLRSNVTDYAALMALKSRLVLPRHSILSTNWTSATHHCSWFGVSCSNDRVTAVSLSGLGVGGRCAPDIANMSHLIDLDLSSNKLGGVVPTQLGSLHHLKTLNLTRNSLGGTIPSNLSHCQQLQQLDLSYNFIEGTVPKELGTLRDLRHLAIDHNNLTGEIPASLGNFSRLEYLYLQENDLFGEIPAELGKLSDLIVIALRRSNLSGSIPPSIFINMSRLQVADLSINAFSGWLPENLGETLPNLERLFFDSNRITGKIPASLSNASKLSYLFFTENDLRGGIPDELGSLRDLVWFEFEYNQISGGIPHALLNITSLQVLKTRHNYLSGELPHDLGNWLPNLQEIFLSHNLFTGGFPPSICNASSLVYLELSNNSFSGPVPMMLGKLRQLEHLNLQVNLLVNNPLSTHLDFLNSLVNCKNLEYLILERNPLNGVLPDSVGNLSSNLKVFTVISCELKGGIPHGIANLSSLNFLGLSGNDMQGEVPSSFGSFQSLERLYLTGNQLQGSIQPELCCVKSLGILHLGENGFSGSVPACLENLTELRQLSLAANSLNSTIPLGFWNLVKMGGLNLSRNHLHGVLPTELGNLKAVSVMDLSANNLSGEIPTSVVNLQSLLSLDMSQNKFEGPIPNGLSNLIVIEFLDLSSNILSGSIPSSLGSLRDLNYLNLSFNMLQGEIPHAGVFTNITYQYLMGNPKLCGAPKLNFPLCSAEASRKRKPRLPLVLKITIPLAAMFLVVVTWILVWNRKKKVENQRGPSVSLPLRHQTITYHELVLATESFSETHLVGRGSSGMVYKGMLRNGELAAIKVLNMQYARGVKNFEAECKVLSRVRHRNLVKIISTCSNEEFKALILEYMPNGSLDNRLHSESNPLSLVERVDIVIDVAMAMAYLHHECIEPIVHCDLKPSNVLLDEDMTAHVADFGIAKILAQDEKQMQTTSLGTIGYIAPEYGLDGQVSTWGDIYSFGILLLETFSGKSPTDDMFGEDMSLHQYITKSFPAAVTEVLDPNLYGLHSVEQGSSRPINKKQKQKQKQVEETVISIIHVALLCLKELPEERIEMREVVVHLNKISAKLVPQNYEDPQQ